MKHRIKKNRWIVCLLAGLLAVCFTSGCSVEETAQELTPESETEAVFEESAIVPETAAEEKETGDQASSAAKARTSESESGTEKEEETTEEPDEKPDAEETEWSFSGTMEVHFLDMGQADATLILTDDAVVLIDAGENETSGELLDYLRYEGVDAIELFVITHYDSDHCGGADDIIREFDVGNLFVSDFIKDSESCEDVLQAISAKGYEAKTPQPGDEISVGEVEITFIAPARSDYSDANNASVGLIVKYGDTSFLFTGDCEEEAEEAILKTGIDLAADVYQVGHHGSRTSSSSGFLKAINPTYAVISCGEGNSYGHPHAATLNSLRMMGVKVFRTDEQGTIVATSDGKTITWNCSPSESWQSGEQTMSDQDQADLSVSISAEVSGSGSEMTGYVGNANTKKFHVADCDSVKQMSEKNKVDLSGYTREEILQMGYSPCGNCNP